MDVYENLKQKGLALIPTSTPGGEYVKVKEIDGMLYVSGHGPNRDGISPAYTGKLGREISLEQGQECAELCALNILGCLHNYLGDLNRIESVVKLLAFVSCTDDFEQQPQVINHASRIFIQAFGEAGRHARSAIGTNSLPGNIPVEIEAIFKLKA